MWNVHSLLRGTYYLFKDSPARRADFTALTGSKTFPMKFCQIRWVENSNCAQRGMDILKDVRKYVSVAKLPATVSVGNVKKALDDPLILPKLSFFKLIAETMEPFLTKFQTANPMAPFLYAEMTEMVKSLLRRFIKGEVIDAATTAQKLIKIDVTSKENFIPVKDIDIGFATRKHLYGNKVLSDRMKLEFQLQCRHFLAATVGKIFERSPLKYTAVRTISALDPKIIFQKPENAQQRMESCLTILHRMNRITDAVAERAKQQFSNLCQSAKNSCKGNFEIFLEEESPLDKFFCKLLKDKKEYQDLWAVFKMVLIVSHGNATVESGFSINKGLLIENLKETSLVALRQVYDGINSSGGILNIEISREILCAVKGSRARYEQALMENKKELEVTKTRQETRKRILTQLKQLKNKKLKVMQSQNFEAEELNKEIASLERNLAAT